MKKVLSPQMADRIKMEGKINKILIKNELPELIFYKTLRNYALEVILAKLQDFEKGKTTLEDVGMTIGSFRRSKWLDVAKKKVS